MMQRCTQRFEMLAAQTSFNEAALKDTYITDSPIDPP